ncbi:MAG: hypothetical protein IKI21_12440 [Oscillospiraceae bacterium]|nr:hypothetical protein [Oscillospiraceae bacterium]
MRDEVILDFHTVSLPSAELVWHCPYIVLFTSEDGRVGGPGYRELALLKLNGESTLGNDDAETVYAALTGDQVALTDIRVH